MPNPLVKRAKRNTIQEVDVEEVLTATLPNEPVSGDEELDILSNPLLASPPGKEVKKKEVQSSDSEVDLFAPPPTAPVPPSPFKCIKSVFVSLDLGFAPGLGLN